MTPAEIAAKHALAGRANERTSGIIQSLADKYGIEPAIVDAIIVVESGAAYDQHRLLRFLPERHKLYRDLRLREPAGVAENALRLGLASKNPSYKGFADYSRATASLSRWKWFDATAGLCGIEYACRNASWGSPQIMGFNAHRVGYATAFEMVDAFADEEDKQIEAMFAYFKATALIPALRERDWRHIARAYNGPNYHANNYDVRIERAYRKSQHARNGLADVDNGFVDFGDRGPQVKELQEKLVRLGFSLDPDGDFGDETEDAVRAFQRRNGLTIDGKVGEQTAAAIAAAYPKDHNQKPVTQILAESKQAHAGAAMVVGGGTALATGIGRAVEDPAAVIEVVKQANDAGEVALDAIGTGSKLFTILSANATVALGILGIILGGYVVHRVIYAIRRRRAA